jgi:hypothetical protein
VLGQNVGVEQPHGLDVWVCWQQLRQSKKQLGPSMLLCRYIYNAPALLGPGKIDPGSHWVKHSGPLYGLAKAILQGEQLHRCVRWKVE